jgi:L-rhamnose isomerase
LEALLEPYKLLVDAEKTGRFTERLALMEEFKTLPFCAVWDKLCLMDGVAAGCNWIGEVNQYEKNVLVKRK